MVLSPLLSFLSFLLFPFLFVYLLFGSGRWPWPLVANQNKRKEKKGKRRKERQEKTETNLENLFPRLVVFCLLLSSLSFTPTKRYEKNKFYFIIFGISFIGGVKE